VGRYKLEHCKPELEHCKPEPVHHSNQNLERTTEVRSFGLVRNNFEPVQNNFQPVRNNFEPVRNNFEPVRRTIPLALNMFLSELRKSRLPVLPTVKKNLLLMELTELMVRRYETQNQLLMVPTETTESVQKMMVRRHEPQNQLLELMAVNPTVHWRPMQASRRLQQSQSKI